MYQRSQSFDSIIVLNHEALLELDRWSTRQNLMEGKKVSTQEPDFTMETDASMLGWGAVCQDVHSSFQQSGGTIPIIWNSSAAAWFGLKALAKDRRNIHIHLKMDNRTAVFYTNWMGGARSPVLSSLAIQVWQWWNLSITAEYLPGVKHLRMLSLCSYSILLSTAGKLRLKFPLPAVYA